MTPTTASEELPSITLRVNTTARLETGTTIFLAAALVLLAAIGLAGAFGSIYQSVSNRPETALILIGAVGAVAVVLPLAAYLLVNRGHAEPAVAGLMVLLPAGIVLTAAYLFWVSSYIHFPGDFLIWTESDYVNDILKFRTSYPLYSAQANNESFTYPPGSQILTYMVARLIGRGTSIPTYRMIQIAYTFLAALIATACCSRIAGMMAGSLRYPALSIALRFAVLFLIATNSITNPFTHNLNCDGLALLMNVLGFYLLLAYASNRSRRVLVLMALLPAAGFLVKQSVAIWAALYCGHLGFFDRPRSLNRLLVFAAGSFGLIGVVVAGCYALWGAPFFYWIFYVLSAHAVSPMRSVQHLLAAWVYLAAGVAGGLLVIDRTNFRSLLGPWIIWLALFLAEAHTSGIAWMLNHMGPGCLLAGLWLLAGLSKLVAAHQGRRDLSAWAHAAGAVAIAALSFSGLGVVRIPVPPLGDTNPYLKNIERQFEGLPADRVLLDAGSWIYLPSNVVMKDRAPSIGERGYSGTGDFTAILGRIQGRYYRKLLIRGLHSPDFWYDHAIWPKSSGIRAALQANYTETGSIPALPEGPLKNIGHDPYLCGEISILVPKAAFQ